VVRWEPGTKDRLRAAALDLFATHGYEQTTAAEIAQSVGLTERTFFRHFGDKRDVLFDGQADYLQAYTEGVEAAPQDASAFEMISSALATVAGRFGEDRRPYSRIRKQIIDANPALAERELHKRSEAAATLAAALHARGVTEPTATLAAESGATAFGIAFTQWVRADETRTMAEIIDDVLAELRSFAVPRRPDHPVRKLKV
jgi:AcrR family transcriptional regulator